MMFEYDSWNRVQRIVYPDSEVVTYNYDLAGNLNRVHTYKANHRDTLIKNILYDEFGHRTQVNFGNGVITNYTYDILQRLSLLETQKTGNPALQKISYTFDNEDNITRVANTTAPVNGLGGSYTFDYQYDNLYRLTSSTGSFTPTNASYYLEMDFTPAGRVCRKEQGDNNGSKRLLYGYNPTNAPHAARRIYDPSTTNLRQMLWDANGNIAQISEYLYDATNEIVNLQDFRNHYWDEDDRLNLVLDNSHFSYYLYGYDGQRVAKLTGSAFTLGTGFATNALLDNYTLYPSEYLVVTQQGYTKYYYAGGTRIASKLGSGGFEKMTRLCTLDLNLTYNANTLFNSVVARIGEDMPQGYISDPCPNYYSDIAGFRVPLPTLNFDPNFGITAQQNILQAFRQNYANEETYFFHDNHLGSANWVTLQNASPTQFLLHQPYGEEFVKQLNGSYDERFTFTGKEKDIETGYYYFGARFDNVDLGFMSVDPMSDKYPSMSPYAYCAWNPVKLVDPDGETGVPVIDKNKKTITVYSKLYFFGSGATTELSKKIATGIAKQWNSANAKYTIDGEKYSVKFRISYETVSEEKARKLANNNTDPKNNFIRVAKGPKGKSSLTYQNGNSFWFNTDDDLEESTTPAHEYGHGLGLKHPNEDLSNETERPHIMIPRKKPYGEKWSIFIDGKQVVNPDKRIVTEKNVQEALDNNCGKMNNVIFNEDGSH